MKASTNIQNIINQISETGYEKRCYDFTWFHVFRYDNVDDLDVLTIEIFENAGRDNYNWELYSVTITSNLLFLLDFDFESSIDLQQKAIELKQFIQDNGVRITGQTVEKNI